MELTIGNAKQALDAPHLPAWLRTQRASALETFRSVGVPTRKDEDFKYLDLSALRKAPGVTPFGSEQTSVATVLTAQAQLTGDLLTVVVSDGTVIVPKHAVEGLDIFASTDAYREDAQHLVAPAQPLHSLEALNIAAAQALLSIKVAPGANAGTIHVIHVGTSGDDTAHFTRVTIELGANASAHVIETYISADDAAFVRNVATASDVAAGAQLRHTRVQREGDGVIHTAATTADVRRDATYRVFNLTLGAKLSRDDLRIRLLESGSHADLAALYLASRKQTVDHHTVVDHMAPHCTSDQLYKGILRGASHAVFNGKVFVRQIAQQTDAQQLNQNLLLSENTRVDTKPQLEIFADDVKCSHGATIGQLDPESLFYLATRGITPTVARQLVIRGFAFDAIQRIADDDLRADLDLLINDAFTDA